MANQSVQSAPKRDFEFDYAIITACVTVFGFFVLPKVHFFDEWTVGKCILIALAFDILLLVPFTLYAYFSHMNSAFVRFLTKVRLKKTDKKVMSPKARVIWFCICDCAFVVLLLLLLAIWPKSSKNYLKATIDGEELRFALMSAVKGPVGKSETSIGVVYYHIDGFHNIRYTLLFLMDGHIKKGQAYTERDKESKIQIVLTKGFIFDVGLSGNMYVASVVHEDNPPELDKINVADNSYFQFELTDRDEKWAHYQGKFNANLQRQDRNGLTDETLAVDSVEFDFSITEDIVPMAD